MPDSQYSSSEAAAVNAYLKLNIPDTVLSHGQMQCQDYSQRV